MEITEQSLARLNTSFSNFVWVCAVCGSMLCGCMLCVCVGVCCVCVCVRKCVHM